MSVDVEAARSVMTSFRVGSVLKQVAVGCMESSERTKMTRWKVCSEDFTHPTSTSRCHFSMTAPFVPFVRSCSTRLSLRAVPLQPIEVFVESRAKLFRERCPRLTRGL